MTCTQNFERQRNGRWNGRCFAFYLCVPRPIFGFANPPVLQMPTWSQEAMASRTDPYCYCTQLTVVLDPLSPNRKSFARRFKLQGPQRGAWLCCGLRETCRMGPIGVEPKSPSETSSPANAQAPSKRRKRRLPANRGPCTSTS